MTTARQVAADTLGRSHARHGFAADLLDDQLARTPLSAQDRRLVTQLVFGVIRRKGTLDALLKPFIKLPPHAVQPRVTDVLRLGAFQLAFLTHIPKHAAVHETVELAPYVGSPQAKGFVNGVLRRVAELVTDEFVGEPAADAVPFDGEPREPFPSGSVASVYAPPPSEGEGRPGSAGRGGGLRLPPVLEATPGVQPPPPHPAAKRGHPLPPQSRGRGQNPSPPEARGARFFGRYRKLTQPVLPDPNTETPAYLAAAFSWPRWLAARWLARHGRDDCFRLGFWFNAPPPLWLRVNKLHYDRETYRLLLAAALVEADPGENPQSLRLTEHVPVRDLPGYDDGDFAVQDHSSMLVAAAVAPQPGMRVLDLCAAPGGKTTHLAELMDNRGFVTACDIDPKRLETVAALARRLRLKNVETVLLGETADPPPGPFDAALVDVPCSNTGVLGRRPEVRWRLQPREFEHLIRLQTRLLLNAVGRVKPGGVVVYSTCSIEPDENEGVVNAVRRGVRGLALEAEHHAVPGRPSDGGYWARLRKPPS